MDNKKKTVKDTSGAFMTPVENRNRKPLHNNSGSIMGFRADDDTKALEKVQAVRANLGLPPIN